MSSSLKVSLALDSSKFNKGIQEATKQVETFATDNSNAAKAIEKIEVINLSGKTLQTYENANEINIEALPSGAYYLRMTIEDKTIMRKVIKE
mgnify:CR=1 FL=1